MKTELEIARECQLQSIERIAEKIDIPTEELENYGKYIAKVPLKLIDEKRVYKSDKSRHRKDHRQHRIVNGDEPIGT